MTALKPAAELAAAASKPYPNDSDEYRRARTALLAEEIELRRHIERVAAQRRALPLGGEARDYRFEDENGKTVKLADLFGQHDTLVTYFWMFGPQRERPCPMCTVVPRRDRRAGAGHLAARRDRRDRPLAGRAPARVRARARLEATCKFYATVGDDFARDYRGLAPDGSEWPALDVWVKRDGKVLPLLGRRARRHQRSRPGPARRARPDAALEHPRPHARRARRRLVSRSSTIRASA